MKAAFLTGPKRIELREADDPAPPPGGLVMAMGACGICGSDLRRWAEGPPTGVPWLIQGHELAGTVVAVGDGVTGYRLRDRLAVAPDVHCGACYYCRRGRFNLCTDLKLLGITPGWNGGFADRVVLPADLLRNGIVHLLEEGAGYFEGALAETLSSVLASQEKVVPRLGETVVVLGAGPIGCLHAVVARLQGARVIVAEPNPVRRGAAARFGPEAIIDVTALDVVTEVKRLTRGIGADVVICANAVALTQTQAVEMSRRGGRIVLFGGLPKSAPMTQLDSNLIHYGERLVIGAFSYHPRFHEEALSMLARRQVKADDFVTHTRPLSQIAEAFEIAASGAALKVMVVPGE